MAELLSHVLIAFVVLTIASWRLEWLTERWVAVGMVGAVLPDLERIELLVSSGAVRELLGVPFDWGAIHTLGGVILLSGLASTTFSNERRRAFGALVAGASSHLLTDAAKLYADGNASAWLYPVVWSRPPTPSLYASADVRVVVAVAATAIVVRWVDRNGLGAAASRLTRGRNH